MLLFTLRPVLRTLLLTAAFAYIVHAEVDPSLISCSTGVSVTPSLRGEGLTEQVGDITLSCTGGTPTASGSPVPTVTLQLSFGTAVTSRLFSNGWSEALLVVDEPNSGLPGSSN